MNIYYYKVTKLDVVQFWKNIIHMLLVPAILVVLFKLAALILIDFYQLSAFLAGVIVYTLLYCLLMYFTQMNEYEKNIVKKPLQMIKHKIKKRA